jgi:ribosomal protein S18 acetylase RimI-like enzyme
MVDQEIAPAGPGDRERAVASCVAAFAADPVIRYQFPDDATYPRHATTFFGYLFDKRAARGTVWTIGAGLSVAMWDSPGSGPADTVLDLPPAEKARLDAYDEAIHPLLPTYPHWYLGVLATHPDHRGRRWGRALIADGLRRAAADSLPAVLETSNPSNVGVYERAGFGVIGEITHGPVHVWVMEAPA